MIPTLRQVRHCSIRFQTTRVRPLTGVLDTCPQVNASHTKQGGARMYRVYYIQDTVEHLEGFYETQEEAEEVAGCVSDDYEPERVEVRDRFDNIIIAIGDEEVVGQ